MPATIAPSNKTVLRFVSWSEFGPNRPFTRLVLGYGYQNNGGETHYALRSMYLNGVEDSPETPMYAGYLHLQDDGKIAIFEGGSMSLRIWGELEKNKVFMEQLNAWPEHLVKQIHFLAKQIMGGEIYHLMVSNYD